MRIIPFDPYGSMIFQEIAKDPQERKSTSISEKIAEEISRNESLRMALLAIAEQEDREKKQRHRFKILTKKQTKVLLGQLRHFRLDFQKLQMGGTIEWSWDDETELICGRVRANMPIWMDSLAARMWWSTLSKAEEFPSSKEKYSIGWLLMEQRPEVCVLMK